MKLTTKSEYSLLALIHFARNSDGSPIKLEEICTLHNISKKYLENLFMVLKQNRYIKAKRGSNGGYMLARKPSDISVAEIIRLMDGALAPTESVSRYFFSHTPLENEEKIMNVFQEIRDYISDKLENLYISDLV